MHELVHTNLPVPVDVELGEKLVHFVRLGVGEHLGRHADELRT